jgi:DNA-binding NtrC family response regulator
MASVEEARLAERLRRLEAIDPLLATLGSVLDVREVFGQVARVARAAVPHDLLVLGSFGDDLGSARVYAFSEALVGEPETVRWSPYMREFFTRDSLITRDLEDHPDPRRARFLARGEDRWVEVDIDATMKGILLGGGIRSTLNAAVRARGRVVGGLLFFSRTRAAFDDDDAWLACRIADLVGLALAHEQLAAEARQAAEARARAEQLEARVARLTEQLAASGGPHRQVGVSRAWRDVLAQATRVAPTDATVLLTGESGTGKEVVARFLHRASLRKDGPFVALNCAALPEQLLESELFGHERGAFTGATTARAGSLEQAAGGVLFLDEVGEMSLPVQAKFLRVLQEREFQRLGGTGVRRAEVRIVAATNRDLTEAIAQRQFREDLFYRLHVFEIRLPPLRERPEDVLALLDHFVRELGAAMGRPAAGVSVEARETLLAHAWPGNVRELRNAVERAIILCEGGLITSEHLPIQIARRASAAEPSASATLPAEGLDLERVERELVEQALARAGNNKSKAARLLGLTRAQLYTRLERHGLAPARPED